jgi:hypothetical protein
LISGWLESAVYTPSYKSLKKALEENYYNAKELKWKDASALWHEKQGSCESVSQYIVRTKRLARNFDFSPEILHMAILQGFRPATRNQVIQKDTSNFEELVKTAELDESVEDTIADSTTATLLSMVKTQISAAEKHSDQLDKLSQTVAGSQEDTNRKCNRPQNANSAGPSHMRTLKPTPQNQQRLICNRFTQRTQQEAADVRPTNQTQPNGTVCGNCAFSHPQGNCLVRSQICRRCAKVGHFARAYRSVRMNSANTNRPQINQSTANRQ